MSTRFDEPAPAEPYLSVSRLRTYAQCGEKFKLRYIDNVPRSKSGAAIAGSAIHDSIEFAEKSKFWNDGKELTKGRFQEIDWLLSDHFKRGFTEAIEDAGGPDQVRWSRGRAKPGEPAQEGFEWWLASGPMQLRRYMQLRGTDMINGIKVLDEEIESRVMARLPSGTLVMMYIDVILAVDEDGSAFIRDYKSGSMDSDAMQLATYAWGIKEARGITAGKGELIKLRTVDPVKRVKTFELAPFIELVPEYFARHEAAQAAGVYVINPSNFCKSCEVKAHCAYGKNVEDAV